MTQDPIGYVPEFREGHRMALALEHAGISSLEMAEYLGRIRAHARARGEARQPGSAAGLDMSQPAAPVRHDRLSRDD